MKFCGNCGNSVPDDARACPYCGSMLDGGPAPAPAKGGIGGFIQSHKKLLIAACAGIVGLIAVILILSAIFGGSYKTPIKEYYARQNSKDYDIEDRFVNQFDGLGKKQLKAIYKIISSSKNWKDAEDDYEDNWKEFCDNNEDEYGKDWKYTYEITDTDELDKDDLKDIKDEFKEAGATLIDAGKRILDMDNDELKDQADSLGLKKDDLKELGKLLKELGQELKGVELKKGYEVDIDWAVEGKDGDDDGDYTWTIVKADGDWVDLDNISAYYVMGFINSVYES